MITIAALAGGLGSCDSQTDKRSKRKTGLRYLRGGGPPLRRLLGHLGRNILSGRSRVGRDGRLLFRDGGGCSDGRPYPPPRLATLGRARNDLDPSLAYDISEFGHLGFDASDGPPDPDQPVQSQYRGTWATWNPPNDDPRVGRLLAKHVVDYLANSAAK
ncbi:MAG: hypothetical protein CL799_10060 [Chromatiales bacterium]|nr:hypothetical protein [Chromatiales bacterium]